MPVCWNWQTRRTQNPLVAIPCGFKSHYRHQCAVSLKTAGHPVRQFKWFNAYTPSDRAAPGKRYHSFSFLFYNRPLFGYLPPDNGQIKMRVELSWGIHASLPAYRPYHAVRRGHGRRNTMAIYKGASSNGRTPGSDPDNIGSNPVAPANFPASKTGSGTVCEKRQVARPSERTSNGTV